MAAVLLYDGACAACDAAVRFVLAHDATGRFRFARHDGEVGRALLARHGLTREMGRTMVLVEGDRAYVRSEAVLRVAEQLPGAGSLARIARRLPRRWRDAAYDLLARNRHRVLGARPPRCAALSPEQRRRFLDP